MHLPLILMIHLLYYFILLNRTEPVWLRLLCQVLFWSDFIHVNPVSVLQGLNKSRASNTGALSCAPENPWQLVDCDGKGVWPVFTRLKTSVTQAGGLQFPWKPKTLSASGLVWKRPADWPELRLIWERCIYLTHWLIQDHAVFLQRKIADWLKHHLFSPGWSQL